eukprot:88946_1
MNIGSSTHAPKDIISYLSAFEDGTLVSLYVDEFTSLTVFRSLRGLAKQYVMNLVLCSKPIPKALIEKWALPSSAAHHKAAMHKLFKLKIFESVDTGDKIKLNANFRECLIKVMFGASSCSDMMYVVNADNSNRSAIRHPTRDKIERHSKSRWETILNILVGVGDNKSIGDSMQNQAISNLLIGVGLIRRDPKTNSLQITAEGFKFLYCDIHSQIWQIIIAYLSGVEQRKLNRKQVLMFLFKLSFLTCGVAYSTSNFNDDQKCVVVDLARMGLLFQKKTNSLLFYPTNLAKHLSSGQSLTKQERDERGFIIVETTFKVYAYTSSHLQIKLLSKFIQLDYRLPNLITGKITKQSVMDAVCKGILVDLIIDYLEQYAHKRMKEQEPILPINVVDQMRLWEAENKRIKIEPAFMICLIPTDKEFDEFIRIVTAAGRQNDERATLLADSGAPDQIQQIITKCDKFVNENNKINSNNSNTVNVDTLLDKTLRPLIISLLQSLSDQQHHQTQMKAKYQMILTKYGWNMQQGIFTKKLNVNDIMKFTDDLCATHLSEQDMMNSKSKLLWSSKAEKTMVVTPKGRDILKRHRSQKRSEMGSASTSNLMRSNALIPPNTSNVTPQ